MNKRIHEILTGVCPADSDRPDERLLEGLRCFIEGWDQQAIDRIITEWQAHQTPRAGEFLNAASKGLLNDLTIPQRKQLIINWLEVSISLEEQIERLASVSVAVTIIMAGYNTQSTVSRAIQSVLVQTWEDFELLFVDDGSTDQTVQTVRSFSDPRIRIIEQEHKNFAAATNHGIRQARGEFVMGIDADDSIAPDYLEKMMRYAGQHPGFDYYYPAGLLITDAVGNPTGEQWDYIDFDDNRMVPEFLFQFAFSPIPNAASLKRRNLFDRIGLFRELGNAEDFDFLARNALDIRFRRAIGVCGYYYCLGFQSNTARYEQRNQITLDILKDMVRLYPPEILFPCLAKISDPKQKAEAFWRLQIEIFEKHADYYGKEGTMYQQYAQELKKQIIKKDPMVIQNSE